ncbi:hypothetical protein [Rhodocista pekingensis]|uniref:Uncharacterized protein n=1 Tax=Rhodocista pekingensis TaxID=201185 RepID=A0ABW2KV00_9PROT
MRKAAVGGHDPDIREDGRRLAALAAELDHSNRAADRALGDALKAVAATLAAIRRDRDAAQGASRA